MTFNVKLIKTVSVNVFTLHNYNLHDNKVYGTVFKWDIEIQIYFWFKTVYVGM